jgi:hypothetical protein
MDRVIVRMLPAEIRSRHGDEVADMLESSTRPTRDRADVVIAAMGLRLGRMARPLLGVAMLLVAGFTWGMFHAVRNLEHGTVEILDHWWSTFILGGLLTSVTAVAAITVAHRRAAAWRPTI